MIEHSGKRQELWNSPELDPNSDSVINQLFSRVNVLILKIERDTLT